MDLTERVERRLNRRFEDRLVVNWDAINPAVHMPEPVGREFVFEALLDAINPLFDGSMPPNVYIHGPAGSGKSAVVTALSSVLQRTLTNGRGRIHTATRVDRRSPEYVVEYVDTRRTSSEFQLLRQLLDSLVADQIPRRGIGTGELERRLRAELGDLNGAIVVADHLDEPGTPTASALEAYLEPFDDIRWIGVSRTDPAARSNLGSLETVDVPAYNYELVDILTVRGADGLSRRLDNATAKELAAWSDGNAHDALAALFGAAVWADRTDTMELGDEAIERGKDAVPDDCVPIGRVLALPENKRRVLGALLELDDGEDRSIGELSDLVADHADLSTGTVRRYLYELAQAGILERTEVAIGEGTVGRSPSSVRPRFPTLVYSRLAEGAE